MNTVMILRVPRIMILPRQFSSCHRMKEEPVLHHEVGVMRSWKVFEDAASDSDVCDHAIIITLIYCHVFRVVTYNNGLWIG
jgi:hypothetical protein